MKLDNSIFLYGDAHFGHKQIIKYTNRPFKDVEEMDSTLISNWNKIVQKHNKVLVQGDFSFHVKENTTHILKKLNGYKILIMGNHDLNKSSKYYISCGFSEVYAYPIIFNNIIFSHQPIFAPYMFNVHAHLHNNKIDSNWHYCISLENTNYSPIKLADLNLRRFYDEK